MGTHSPQKREVSTKPGQLHPELVEGPTSRSVPQANVERAAPCATEALRQAQGDTGVAGRTMRPVMPATTQRGATRAGLAGGCLANPPPPATGRASTPPTASPPPPPTLPPPPRHPLPP